MFKVITSDDNTHYVRYNPQGQMLSVNHKAKTLKWLMRGYDDFDLSEHFEDHKNPTQHELTLFRQRCNIEYSELSLLFIQQPLNPFF
ncbi:hypothetical protein [Neptunomonas japonica]|uniref:hypothetical protein n=1 Tax=Neptunomonas japonica TaxID=417574 RepID=UPI0019164CAA|nr:hypothetical protein [Neptunomonas japonica]